MLHLFPNLSASPTYSICSVLTVGIFFVHLNVVLVNHCTGFSVPESYCVYAFGCFGALIFSFIFASRRHGQIIFVSARTKEEPAINLMSKAVVLLITFILEMTSRQIDNLVQK